MAIIRKLLEPSADEVLATLRRDHEYTILALFELIREVTGSDSEIVFRPLPEDDPRQRRPDIALARRVLQWTPQVSLREGLILTAGYFHEKLRKESQHKRRRAKPASDGANCGRKTAWAETDHVESKWKSSNDRGN